MTVPNPILRNFKFIGELDEPAVDWWKSFGEHLDAARKNFPPMPDGRPNPFWWLK